MFRWYFVLLFIVFYNSFAFSAPATVECHTFYGGDEEVQVYKPSKSPYDEPTLKRSGFFNIRVVYESSTHLGNVLKFYTYARLDNVQALIHQGTFVIPQKSKSSKYGFTGLQLVYEPTTEAELQYWCDIKSEKK